MSWTYNKLPVNSLDDMPENASGIIYMILTEHGRKYIGKKSLFSIRKKKFGKKKIAALKDARLKKYEMVKKESDWMSYTGSNKELNEDLNSGTRFKRIILKYAFSKQQLTYYETKMLFVKEVLENDEYYNSNISGKFYRKSIL